MNLYYNKVRKIMWSENKPNKLIQPTAKSVAIFAKNAKSRATFVSG